MVERKNPLPTVDLIIRYGARVVLIRRKNPPHGWALPGGFVEYGESLEDAAIREAREETGLDVRLRRQFHTYSDPGRDERFHTITTVYIADAEGRLQAGDDASEIELFTHDTLPDDMAFDHRSILEDYFSERY